MADESGGADPTRGFRYQAKLAEYFFLKGVPSFHGDTRPTELHIEQDDSDFSFFIREDDRECGHFFEAKRKDSGELKWSEFKKEVLTEFINIERNNQRPTDVEFFHIGINTTFARKIDKMITDAEDFRKNKHGWIRIYHKSKREYLGVLYDYLEVEDDEVLSDLVWGLVGHTIPEDQLDDKIYDFLKKCSPRDPKKNKKLIFDEIIGKGSGVIRRNELEDELDIRLEPSNSSTTSSSSLQETKKELESLADDINPGVNKETYFDAESLAREFNENRNEDENEDDVRLESETTNALNKAQELQNLAGEIEQKEFGLKRSIENMIEASNSTDSESK